MGGLRLSAAHVGIQICGVHNGHIHAAQPRIETRYVVEKARMLTKKPRAQECCQLGSESRPRVAWKPKAAF
jgi:hypothetical protein